MRLFSLWIFLFSTFLLLLEDTIVIKPDPALLDHIEVLWHRAKVEYEFARLVSLDLKLANQWEEVTCEEWSHTEVLFIHSVDFLQFV